MAGIVSLTTLLPVLTRESWWTMPASAVRRSIWCVICWQYWRPRTQSPVTEELRKVISPFAKCLKTHFARMAVIEDTIYNGRTASDAVLDSSDRTAPRGRSISFSILI